MRVLYHFTPMPPPMPECVAELQEISLLSEYFSGELSFLNPNVRSPIYVPRFLFGFHQLRHLRRLEKEFDLHHVYNPDPYPFPVLRYLKRPVVYTISGGVNKNPINQAYFNALGGVQVADDASLVNLAERGIENAVAIRPSIEISRYSVSPILPLQNRPFRLLMASGPWTLTHFRTKGIEALLDAARQEPSLEIVFLWRGVLEKEMRQEIERRGLSKQITLINEQVDVNQILASVHATVALAEDVGIMKAYPHSLLDSLAAGRPVLTNQAMPMSQYVLEKEVGVVIDQVDAGGILRGINQLKKKYTYWQQQTRAAAEQDFSLAKMVDSYRALYSSAINRTGAIVQ